MTPVGIVPLDKGRLVDGAVGLVVIGILVGIFVGLSSSSLGRRVGAMEGFLFSTIVGFSVGFPSSSLGSSVGEVVGSLAAAIVGFSVGILWEEDGTLLNIGEDIGGKKVYMLEKKMWPVKVALSSSMGL